MYQQIAFAVKEEILRNLVKTHHTILITGWTGRGKTVTALKATSGTGKVYYYRGGGENIKLCIDQYNNGATILNTLKELNSTSEDSVLIVDGLGMISGDELDRLTGIVTEKAKSIKVILISRAIIDAKNLLGSVDVVVRFRQDTAEVLFTGLYDVHKQ